MYSVVRKIIDHGTHGISRKLGRKEKCHLDAHTKQRFFRGTATLATRFFPRLRGYRIGAREAVPEVRRWGLHPPGTGRWARNHFVGPNVKVNVKLTWIAPQWHTTRPLRTTRWFAGSLARKTPKN